MGLFLVIILVAIVGGIILMLAGLAVGNLWKRVTGNGPVPDSNLGIDLLFAIGGPAVAFACVKAISSIGQQLE